MGISFRGQGATEYLVLLAVVLIIALVSIALLGFFPGLATDARITQSVAYWRGEARPFAIIDSTVSGTTATVVVQNYETSGPLAITSFVIGINTNNSATLPTIAPGQFATISVNSVAGTAFAAGAVYDLPVNITYTTANGLTAKQFGTKNLAGKAQ